MKGIRSRGRGPSTELLSLVSHPTILLPFLVLLCFAGAIMTEAASGGYERTIEQLSEAIASSRTLAKQMVPYDAVFRRDPMQALIDRQGELVTTSGLHGGFSVQGVIWSDEHPLAVIDDELFAQGAVVGPYTILQIQADGVIVQRGKDTLFIPLDRGIETQQASLVQLPSLAVPPGAQPSPASAADDSAGSTR